MFLNCRPPRRFLESDDDDDDMDDADDHAEEQPLSKERRMKAPSPPKVPRSLAFRKRQLSPASQGSARKTPEAPIHNDICLEQIHQYARFGTIRSPRASPSSHYQPGHLTPSASLSTQNFSDKLASSLVELTQEGMYIYEVTSECLFAITLPTPTMPTPKNFPFCSRNITPLISSNSFVLTRKIGIDNIKKKTFCLSYYIWRKIVPVSHLNSFQNYTILEQ